MNKFNSLWHGLKTRWIRLRTSVWCWFFYKSPFFFSINPFRFLRDWWPVRSVFRRPYVRFYKLGLEEGLGGDYFFLETECRHKWFYFYSHPCGYKLKYGEVRFECVPYICFIWRRRVKYVIGLESPVVDDSMDGYVPRRDNDMYWEGLLSYRYDYKRDLYKAYKGNTWTRVHTLAMKDENGDNVVDRYRYTFINCLKPNYAQQIIEEEIKSKKNDDISNSSPGSDNGEPLPDI